LIILLLVRNTLLSGLGPHISGPVPLLGCLLPHPFDTVALVVSQVAPLVYEVAFIAGLVSFLTRLVALICG
jgi:hypothetical protein